MPRLLQLEIVVLVLMIFFGGQSVLTYVARLPAWHLRNSINQANMQLSGPSFGQGVLPRDPADADQGRDAG